MSVVIGNSENFDSEINVNIPVVVDFWAPWCGPCKVLSPILDNLAYKYEGNIKVLKVNVMENHELAKRFKVSSIPYIAVFVKGKMTDSQVGFSGAESLELLFEGLGK